MARIRSHARRVWLRVGAASTALTLAAIVPGAARAAVPPYRDGDLSSVSLNILPPGQGRHLNALEFSLYTADGTQPASNTDQSGMYDALIGRAPSLTADDFPDLFKDASFGVPLGEVVREYSPRAGTTILRDRFDVPHVYGETRDATMFGAGYASAEDRLFMMDVLRHLARGRLSEFLGGSPSNLASDRAQRFVADYTEEELVAMGQRLKRLDPELGAIVEGDLSSFTDGVNAFIGEALTDPTKLPVEYPALQQVPLPWKVSDSIAETTLIGGQFSVGGGGQLANDRFLDALESEHSAADARAIFDDFRFPNDPEAPTATDVPFPFNEPVAPVDPAAVARPDDPAALAASLEASLLPPAIDGPFGPIHLAAPAPASNTLLVSAQLSSSGRPIAVMGPQVGYFSPQILMELDLHGPGVHARGAAFPGLSLYVLLGRGTDLAWSATTAIGDHIDVRAVELCEPGGGSPTVSSASYLNDGSCDPLYARTDTWLAKPSAGGVPDPANLAESLVVSMKTERSRHGIVLGRGTVGGTPVAFVRERSSYNKEVDAAMTFAEIHDPDRISSIQDMMQSFDRFSFSFNWHLVHGNDVGFYTTGLYPVLAPGVDPDLPFWGDSRWDAVRHLTFAEHPQTVNQPYIVNWNNKQAPRFRAADNNWAYGPVGRVSLLRDGVEAALAGDGRVSLVELVQAMGIAATRDVRGVYVAPSVLDVVGTPADPALAQAAGILSDWVNDGAHRRDLDGDGIYEHSAAVALMDALWDPLLEEMFRPTLGDAFDLVPLGHDNGAGPGGSAYLSGWYGQAQKDLRTVLGGPVVAGFSRGYCGDGVLAACRDAVLRALQRAVDALTAADGADPTGWDADEAGDKIQFSAVGVVSQTPIRWQNRPTFQQIVEFGSP